LRLLEKSPPQSTSNLDSCLIEHWPSFLFEESHGLCVQDGWLQDFLLPTTLQRKENVRSFEVFTGSRKLAA